MKFKLIYLPAILPMLFQSCNTGCKIIPLSASDKSWMSFAEMGDTILFSSGSQTDSFVVTTKNYEWLDCNRFELGNGQKETGNIRLRKLEHGHYSYYVNYELAFNSDYMHDTLSVSSKRLSLYNLQTDLFYSFNDFKDSTVFIESLKKMVSTKIIRAGAQTRDQSDVQTKISEFYWNKKLGLVCYKKASGEMFYYSKKL